MKDLIKEYGKDWGFWGHYNFRGAMMYRIVSTKDAHLKIINKIS